MLFVFLVNDKLYKIGLLDCWIVGLLDCWIMVVVKIRKYIGVWGNIQSRN